MPNSGKCKDNLNFRAHYRPVKKIQTKGLGAAKKNKEKVKAIWTGFSACRVLFCRENKFQMMTTSCRIVTLPIHGLFKSFGLYKYGISDNQDK